MRFARKIPLLTIAAIAALAFAAAPASATNPIEVVNEATASHCGDAASGGGCAVHAEGTIRLDRWIFTWGVERVCDIELDMRVGEDGYGEVDTLDHYTTEPVAESDCHSNPPVVMCDAPWEGQGERVNSTTIHAVSDVCIKLVEANDYCGQNMEYDIVEGANESLSVSFVNSHIGTLCRIGGTLQVEGNVPHIN